LTSPTLIYRKLTLNFARAVTPAQNPQVMQVVLTPLNGSTSVPANSTFVEAPVARDVLLAETTNTVVFNLVPSDLAGLSQRLLYRIAWRAGGATGRTFTYDFAMPNSDVTFEQLNSLNYIIGGSVYLQQSDLGVAGRVARLDSSGQVVNASGVPVPSVAALTTLQNSLTAEVNARTSAVSGLRTELQTSLTTQVNQITTSTSASVQSARSELGALLADEIFIRQTAVNNLTAALGTKPTLNNGKLSASVIPDSVRVQGISVANEAAMLSLGSQIQQFDFAIRPDGVWALLGTDPSQLNSWAKYNKVASVNGRDGDVTLTLADFTGNITQGQVTGLITALGNKADNTALTSATGRITAIENSATIVKTVGGVIPNALNDNRMAYVDITGNYITRKDGTIISGAGGAVGSVNDKRGDVVLTLTDVATAGGAVPQAQVTGLVTALSGKASSTDSRLTDSRTPTSHATSHAANGSDALTLSTTQITGLATTLTNHDNRLGSLETRVTAVEAGGSGSGGSGAIGTQTWWAGSTPTGTFSNLALHSPFGYNPTNPAANASGYYFNPAGANSADVRFPYITPNGHLELRKWDESGPADPALATQNSLDALTTIVNGKADTTTVSALTTTVNAKASQSALDSLTTTVNAKASQASVDSLTTTVAGKASQASVDAKASQTSVDTLSSTVSSLSTSVSNKATLTGGVLDAAVVPALPQSRITNLTTDLAAKASLVSGTVPLNQIPTGISQDNISGLTAALSGKADLVNGVLSSSQIPALALTNTVTRTSRAAMLALTSSEVQPGDICVITATADQGSYILTGNDPTQFANWTLLTNPLTSVSSVNGQTGTITLGLGDLSGSIAQSQVTGLSTTLGTKADTTALTTGLAARPAWSVASGVTLESVLSSAAPAKSRVNAVATTLISSLSGPQTIDGVALQVGNAVLLTAQASSVNNGIWQVNSGAWTRPADNMPTGSYLVKGTMVVVTSGTVNATTLWQSSSASGVVDTAANNWIKVGSVGSAYSATAGNGIAVTGSVPNQTFTVVRSPAVTVGSGTTADPQVSQSKGIVVDSTGVSIDKDFVARKYIGTVPSTGGTTPRIYHNLGTRRVLVQVQEVSTGTGVLVGWQASGINYIDLEFATTPSNGQWAVIVIG